ncbi:hypothetical protein ON753_08670 [Roseibium sp. DSM 29163]|uniref:Uncharacterized protein n=1 Tax=Roseibium salinum TaxID=1604349 RepID=A0ABT3QZX9_9HYPH|nr:hypothetical protein [Roseibium sp. DSM 29163]MCX2722470.1 hypothetical protein [Roseibium sp. DSM 29163]
MVKIIQLLECLIVGSCMGVSFLSCSFFQKEGDLGFEAGENVVRTVPNGFAAAGIAQLFDERLRASGNGQGVEFHVRQLVPFLAVQDFLQLIFRPGQCRLSGAGPERLGLLDPVADVCRPLAPLQGAQAALGPVQGVGQAGEILIEGLDGSFQIGLFVFEQGDGFCSLPRQRFKTFQQGVARPVFQVLDRCADLAEPSAVLLLLRPGPGEGFLGSTDGYCRAAQIGGETRQGLPVVMTGCAVKKQRFQLRDERFEHIASTKVNSVHHLTKPYRMR